MLNGIKIGLAVTGSFCNFDKIAGIIDTLKSLGVETIIPIVSYSVMTEENRFTTPDKVKQSLENLTGSYIIDTITKAEPIGPKNLIDILVIVPCTGNTLAKISVGITDTPITMAAKSHVRNNKPVVIAVSTNDGLGANAKNIGELLNQKNIYFVPFGQDDPENKPKSLICDYSKVSDTITFALQGKQIQPILTQK